jgi:hypothetical protein
MRDHTQTRLDNKSFHTLGGTGRRAGSKTRGTSGVLIPVQAAHQNGMMPPAVTE